MKRVFFLIALALLTACTENSGRSAFSSGSGEKLKIVATVFPLYDFAREITGGLAEVTMLLPPGADSHFYEPTPRDIIDINNCDVFLYIGGESDRWAETVLNSSNDGMTTVALIDAVEPLTEEFTEGMETGGDPGGDYDEHIWTSPANAKLIAERISGVICGIDAENAPEYRRNTESFIQRLDGLDAEFKAIVGNAGRNILVFADRFPFRYFAEYYGLDCYAAFPGCSPETEPSLGTVAFLIGTVKENSIPVVLYTESSDRKLAGIIKEETGAKGMLFHSGHTVSSDEFRRGTGYLDLMGRNAEVLREALE